MLLILDNNEIEEFKNIVEYDDLMKNHLYYRLFDENITTEHTHGSVSTIYTLVKYNFELFKKSSFASNYITTWKDLSKDDQYIEITDSLMEDLIEENYFPIGMSYAEAEESMDYSDGEILIDDDFFDENGEYDEEIIDEEIDEAEYYKILDVFEIILYCKDNSWEGF